MLELISPLDPKGLGYAYYNILKKYSKHVAQRDAITEETQTYGELLERCVGAALGMKKNGLKLGDFISICSLNHFDVAVPFIASLFVGAVTSSVDPAMTASEIVHLLNQTMPKMVFVGQEAVGVIEEVAQKLKTKPQIIVFGKSEKHLPFSKFVEWRDEEYRPRQPSSLDETTLVVFSSGTTGKPKGICHSHKSIMSSINEPIYNNYSVIAWLSNPYWISFHVFLQYMIISGMCRLVIRSFDMNDPWKVFKYKMDILALNTTQALTFLKYEKPNDANDENISMIGFGGNYISSEQLLALRHKLPNVQIISGYGQSELFGGAFSPLDTNEKDYSEKYPNCIGTPKKDVLWKIVDIETEEILGPNQQGELRLKSNGQCKGYHNRDSSETFDSEGYLKTGDLAYYNEDMGFFIVNRIKESFKYQHHHIIPSEIERVLLTHPSIEKAVVLGIPHDMDTNHPMAVVELKNKEDCVSEEEIVKFVEERVLHQNRLRAGVKIVKNIPLTVTDKINRFKLREMILHNQM